MAHIRFRMGWDAHLSVNDRYERVGGRTRLRPEVQAWQEELAWKLKVKLMSADIDLVPQLVVDITMNFPVDGRKRDSDNYLKAILDGVEMGTGIDDSNFIPFIRVVRHVPENAAGFVIRLYSAPFAGHGLTGQIAHTAEGPDSETIIILDNSLPSDWDGTKVAINLGVINAAK